MTTETETEYESITLGLTPYNVGEYRTVITALYAAPGTYDEFRAAALEVIARRTIKPGNEEWTFSGAAGSEMVFLEQWIGSDQVFIKRVSRDDVTRWLAAWDQANPSGR
jgi:hypothetical protein